VTDQAEDTTNVVGSRSEALRLGQKEGIQEMEEFGAFGRGPGDTHEASVNVIPEEGLAPANIVLPFRWVDAWRTVRIVQGMAKHEIGRVDAGCHSGQEMVPNMGRASVVNKGRKPPFRVIGMSVPNARIEIVRGGLSEEGHLGRGGSRRQNEALNKIKMRDLGGRSGHVLSKVGASFPFEHVIAGGIPGAEDGGTRDDEPLTPSRGKGDGHVGVIEDAVKGSRDVIRGLEDVVGWITDAEIPNPNEIAHEGGTVGDGRIPVLVDAGRGDEAVDITKVRGTDGGGGIDAKASLGIPVAIGDAEEG
jgi:hypothetical protein